MKEALKTEDDVSILVHNFYRKALKDEVIGPFFNEIMDTSIQSHLPVIIKFWSSLILKTNSYKGNPMLKHIELNKKKSIDNVHFDRWIELWHQTIDEKYIGANAEEAKSKALHIAILMKMKIKKSESPSALL